MLAQKAVKPKKCRGCKATFTPFKPMQVACSVTCALSMASTQKDKARKAIASQARVEHREAKERIKSKGEHAKEAQQAFNEFIRLRDKDLPCVSCGRHHEGQWHAGHYRTVSSSPELRFEPLNVAKQCAPCNNHMSGNIVNYRIELRKRIGQDMLDWLEGPHEPKRYTIEDLKAIKAQYRAMARELKRKEA